MDLDYGRLSSLLPGMQCLTLIISLLAVFGSPHSLYSLFFSLLSERYRIVPYSILFKYFRAVKYDVIEDRSM
jgi:hypothetical protein